MASEHRRWQPRALAPAVVPRGACPVPATALKAARRKAMVIRSGELTCHSIKQYHFIG